MQSKKEFVLLLSLNNPHCAMLWDLTEFHSDLIASVTRSWSSYEAIFNAFGQLHCAV